MAAYLVLSGIEKNIDRLMFPAFHPLAFPINARRHAYQLIIDSIEYLYDCSNIDVLDYDRLSGRALHAYVNGGL